MTVADRDACLWPSLKGPDPNLKRRNGNKPVAGLQVVATLLALRVGYRLAKSAVGKLFAEPKVSPVRHNQQQVDEQDTFEETAADVTARDQWVVCSQPAPDVPDGFKLMAAEHIPISSYHFYEQFLSVETTCLQDHHKSTGQYSFKASRWQGPDGDDNHFSRTLDFKQPKKGMQPTDAHCIQQQTFSVHPGNVFVMRTDMWMQHIPYADCFRVQSFWKAEPDSTGVGTNVSIHVAVPFMKGCLVKGIIIKTTLADCKTFYSDFLAKVQNSISTELLPQAAAAAAASEQLLGASPGVVALSPQSIGSPFATVDAEVFVRTPYEGSLDHSFSRNGSQQRQQQHKARGWWTWRHHEQQQQQQPHQLQHAAGIAADHAADVHHLRQLSRAVSAKPSFGQPISELHLAGRVSQKQEFIASAQAIVVLLVLLVQLLTLYDNMALHHKLAAAMSMGQ